MLEDDPKVLVMGEDVGRLGGVFRITEDLQKDFGKDQDHGHRRWPSPASSAPRSGSPCAATVRWLRSSSTVFCSRPTTRWSPGSAKMHARSLGKVKLPMVIRIPYGGGIGAIEHHSESPESLLAQVAGLKRW